MTMTPIGFPFGSSLQSGLCTFCNVHAQYLYKGLYYDCGHEDPPIPDVYQKHNISIHKCSNCQEESVFLKGKKIFPLASDQVDPPNSDLPESIKADYIEAANIVEISPRGAAALLRLCIQKLCNYLLNVEDCNINRAIDDLRVKGLKQHIVNAFDVVRVTGNNAVHPGQMALREDVDTVLGMFKMVNLIANDTITDQKEVQMLMGLLPQKNKDQIDKRNKKR